MKVSMEDDTGIQPYVTMCSCKHMTIWQACMYGYKGKTETDGYCVRVKNIERIYISDFNVIIVYAPRLFDFWSETSSPVIILE